MTKIVFATSNKGKFSWFENELKAAGLHHVQAEQQALDLTEIQSTDIAAISLFKAKQAYAQLKTPVVVHDGGFFISGLNGFPGAYTKDMIETIGVETIAKIIGVLDDKACQFRNVATFIDGENSYRQFFDTTIDIFTLTSDLAPHDHPKQWSALWRVLVPSGLGYAKPLAALSDAEIEDYFEKRRQMEAASSLKDCVAFVKNHYTAMAA